MAYAFYMHYFKNTTTMVYTDLRVNIANSNQLSAKKNKQTTTRAESANNSEYHHKHNIADVC